LTYSTNAGNLRLEMADFLDERQHPNRPAAGKPAAQDPNRTTEIESSVKPATPFIPRNPAKHPPSTSSRACHNPKQKTRTFDE